MGFRDSQTISTIHFFLLLFFFSLGAFFLILPWTHAFRYAISDLLLNKPEIFFSVGCLVLMISMVFGFGFYSLHRQRSLRVKMDPGLVEIDPNILKAYLETYWKSSIPIRRSRPRSSFPSHKSSKSSLTLRDWRIQKTFSLLPKRK